MAGIRAGLAGAAVMTTVERVEQRLTGRPDSYVPARTLTHLFRLRRPNGGRCGRNMAMHYGTGALVGVARGVMAGAGLRGPWAATLFTPLRLTVENASSPISSAGIGPHSGRRKLRYALV